MLDKLLRLKTAPIMFGLPFGLMPGVFGHIPLPAKITIQVLEKIDLRERYGEDPDVDAIYDDVIARMQDVLGSLSAGAAAAGDRMRIEEIGHDRRAARTRCGSCCAIRRATRRCSNG